MKDVFERLQRFALAEFGCNLIKSHESTSFQDLFGFSHEDIATYDDVHIYSIDESITYVSEKFPIFDDGDMNFDVVDLPQCALAA